VEALTKQNGVRLFGKLKKKFKIKVKTDLPYLSFYKKKPETHIFFFWPCQSTSKFFSEGKLLSANHILQNVLSAENFREWK
jgi:hypothetical protein